MKTGRYYNIKRGRFENTKPIKIQKVKAGVNIEKGELCYLKDGLLYPCEPNLYKLKISEEKLLEVIKEEVYKQFKKSGVKNVWLEQGKLAHTIAQKQEEWING